MRQKMHDIDLSLPVGARDTCVGTSGYVAGTRDPSSMAGIAWRTRRRRRTAHAETIMSDKCKHRAAALLREAPDHSMALGDLYERLRAEMLPATSPEALLAALQSDPATFTTVEPADPFCDERAWTEHERAEYQCALESVGAAGETRVALNPRQARSPDLSPPSLRERSTRPASPLASTERALLPLWAESGEDRRLRADVGAALAELDRMRARLGSRPPRDRMSLRKPRAARSTTPPRDPRHRS
jgi:hypothetical protein